MFCNFGNIKWIFRNFLDTFILFSMRNYLFDEDVGNSTIFKHNLIFFSNVNSILDLNV